VSHLTNLKGGGVSKMWKTYVCDVKLRFPGTDDEECGAVFKVNRVSGLELPSERSVLDP
jgi:hypothetical protein